MLLRCVLVLAMAVMLFPGTAFSQESPEQIKLPTPDTKGTMSVEEAIYKRRSVRDFKDEALTLGQVSQLLWCSGGVTLDGLSGPTRAYPSAGAVYPLDIYLVAGKVKGLDPGVYLYEWRKHMLKPIRKGDLRDKLASAALGQRMVLEAPVSIVVTAMHSKTARRYGERGAVRYVSMDVGHLGENVHLISESMGLGTVMVGAFIDKKVMDVLKVKDQMPMYIMPVGVPAGKK